MKKYWTLKHIMKGPYKKLTKKRNFNSCTWGASDEKGGEKN